MCGIAGHSGDFDAGLIDRMTGTLAHRGSDSHGVVRRGGVALGHRRLAILDLSAAGAQPMWDASGRCVTVYNGEIYNFAELRRELQQTGVTFRGLSDTEVLINLYARDGVDMLHRLNGMFALAIHDTASGDTLLARDRFGVKPLYYAETRRGVLFASEIKALLADAELDRSVDPEAALAYLVHLWAPSPLTMLRAVRKLEPGCAMILRGKTVHRRWRYHEPDTVQPVDLPAAEAVGRVRETLRAAVERQMISDVPVGAFLSGGLDSSAVAAFAQQAAPGRRLQCFTIDLDTAASRAEGIVSDLPYAREVARHLGVDLHEVRAGPEIVDSLETMIFHLEEPQGDPAALHVMKIAALARDHGIKVLLSGAGGDDLFSGYRRHQALVAESLWSWLPAPLRLAMERGSRLSPTRHSFSRRVSKALAYAGEEPRRRLARHFAWIDPDIARSLLSDGDPSEARRDRLVDAISELPAGMSPLRRMLALEQRFFLADHNLNYADKMSMASGVETRVPFLDNDLADLANSLPDRLKQRGLTGKWVLKRALADILPAEIIHRPKTGFGSPLRTWLAGPLRPLLNDTIASARFRGRGLWKPSAVADLALANERGRVDASYTLFTVLCIELWFQIFIDRAPARHIRHETLDG